MLKFLERDAGNSEKEKNKILKSGLFGLGVGFLSALTIASWGGVATFIFMIIPLSFGLIWFIRVRDLKEIDKKQLKGLFLFYIAFFVTSILSGLIYGFTFQSMISRLILGMSNILFGAVLLFILVDYLLINYGNKIKLVKEKKLEKYHLLYSLIIVLILGIILIWILKGNLISYVLEISSRLLHPFGTGRTGLTVAENKQPYLMDWINDIGKYFFWMFYLGMAFVGFNISKGISNKKSKVLFSIVWVAMISGILFSRISANSMFNGTNFISSLVYIGGIILFLAYSIKIYVKKEINLTGSLAIIFAWLFFMLIAGRGAVRLLFVIAPFATFMGGYLLVNLFNYAKSSRDDLLKILLIIGVILSLIVALIAINRFISSTSLQAKVTGPSANTQWQNAMAWIRENTQENSIFVHWWDYGYWVQYLGERPTVTDGGHAVGFWDHLIGRYILTTPYPETALSFMKTHDVSYLLIDPTDIGKYGAYSRIGSDEKGDDRYSYIPTMFLDTSQAQGNNTKVYQGVAGVDEDIIYNSGGEEIFLPRDMAYVIGTILQFNDNGGISGQPRSAFFYNNQQVYIPIRYLYNEGKITDFGGGLEATIYILPTATPQGNGGSINIDNSGSLMYLSPLVSSGLFAQLYLMNDPFDNYSTLRLAHSQQDPFMQFMNSQGFGAEFVYYNGIHGPIKIWEVSYLENIVENKEFLKLEGKYAEFDNLTFTK